MVVDDDDALYHIGCSSSLYAPTRLDPKYELASDPCLSSPHRSLINCLVVSWLSLLSIQKCLFLILGLGQHIDDIVDS